MLVYRQSVLYRDYRVVVLSVKVEPGNITEIMQPPTSLPLNRIFSTDSYLHDPLRTYNTNTIDNTT